MLPCSALGTTTLILLAANVFRGQAVNAKTTWPRGQSVSERSLNHIMGHTLGIDGLDPRLQGENSTKTWQKPGQEVTKMAVCQGGRAHLWWCSNAKGLGFPTLQCSHHHPISLLGEAKGFTSVGLSTIRRDRKKSYLTLGEEEESGG
ncbi:uncharacterized protein BDZ83DRAFT_604663 [Colletotrichum acutatum]|uniref:Uncharacterized protein n=1 Tax=Glomerella acutata TaxID=27357 RepID=A0AAD8XLQ4_GLOAC|nr:uncharacterized protein BDZ83DRAFT_604663 [Colletotrichum acutatum]KAK1729691.1 hypothetical protein BDZ83DRAFT_604663 [Colletotrichum acutatum]